HERVREPWQARSVTVCPARFDRDVPSLDVAALPQPLPKGFEPIGRTGGGGREVTNSVGFPRPRSSKRRREQATTHGPEEGSSTHPRHIAAHYAGGMVRQETEWCQLRERSTRAAPTSSIAQTANVATSRSASRPS